MPNSFLIIGDRTHSPQPHNGDRILITIDDLGSGVAPEITKNLFQKFVQGTDKSGTFIIPLDESKIKQNEPC
jgi:signal transduction histidine kinase